MHRRSFLAGASIAAVTVAGCSEFQGGGSGSSGLTSPVESLVDAYAANDSEAAAAAVNPDGPLASNLPDTLEDRSLTLENATVASQTDANATVRANVSVATEYHDWVEPREFELRAVDGDWTIWSMATGPELALREYVGAIDAGRVDAAMALLDPESADRQWIGGDLIEQASLSIEGDADTLFHFEGATVEARVVETMGGVTLTRERSVELRRVDGDWVVRSLQFGPIVAVYRLARAYDESDRDAYDAVRHPDGELPDSEEGFYIVYDEFTIESVTSVSASDGEATVEAQTTLVVFGERVTQVVTYDVRPHEGEWRVYGLEGE